MHGLGNEPMATLSIPDECVSPEAPPWRRFDECIYFYEYRIIPKGDVQLRVLFRHCLKLLGRQQGALVYTLTLLPCETVNLYQYDRYRRTRSDRDLLSIRGTFVSRTAELHRNRSTSSRGQSQTLDIITETDEAREGSGVVIGGALIPADITLTNPAISAQNTLGISVQDVSQEFSETLKQTTLVVEAERSVVVSTFEDEESRSSTVRRLENKNECRAVTYFVRRVNEVFQLTSTVLHIDYRQQGETGYDPWRVVGSVLGLSDEQRKILEELLKQLPEVGQTHEDATFITLPTDGLLYEPELAHCASCDTEKKAEILVRLEKEACEARRICAEAEVLEMEAERRKALIAAGQLDPFEPAPVLAPTAGP